MAYFCLGLVRGWSSPGVASLNVTLNEPDNLPNSTNYFEMSNEDLTWICTLKYMIIINYNLIMSSHIIIASLPPFCGIFGSLLIMAPMKYLGRKPALILISFPYIIGFLLMGFTFYVRHKSILYVGRILNGLMLGSSTPAAQIYV